MLLYFMTRNPIPDDMLDLFRESVAEANVSNSDLLGAKIWVEDERVQKDKTKGKEKVIEEALSTPFTQIPWHKSYLYSSLASIGSKSMIQDKNSDEEYQISDEKDKTSDKEDQASDKEEGEVDELPIAVRPYIYVDTGSDQEESRSSDIKVLETTESQGSKVQSSTKHLHTDANDSASDEPLRKRSCSAEIVKTTTTEPSSSTAPPMDPTLSFLTSMPLAIMHKSSEDLYKK
ncbi:hypothetical protein BDP27DRAFT_1427821 [Rhodocollybia butyracea]|uniref:Uncharacterized protein n=1 Tax=Rhodocollybia butyracea TaxID=206335 RepID=A0A9P5U1K3_9AGAR|nr:hypothetical protein BDP27DRAFT_1427821 [Rhodocollybia butyracea]